MLCIWLWLDTHCANNLTKNRYNIRQILLATTFYAKPTERAHLSFVLYFIWISVSFASNSKCCLLSCLCLRCLTHISFFGINTDACRNLLWGQFVFYHVNSVPYEKSREKKNASFETCFFRWKRIQQKLIMIST